MASFPEFDGVGITTKDTCKILDRLNVGYIRYVDSALFYGRVYIIGVPSLTRTLGSHDIVVDSRGVNMEEWLSEDVKVYDPNKGYPGRDWYEKWEDVGTFYGVIEIVW